MASRVAVILGLLLALSGYGLYQQIQSNGSLKKMLEQRDRQLSDQTRAMDALHRELIERDEAVRILEAKIDEHGKRAEQVRTVVRKVYVQPEVQPWANTVPPHDVARAVLAGIDCLWEHSDGNPNCGDLAAGSHDG